MVRPAEDSSVAGSSPEGEGPEQPSTPDWQSLLGDYRQLLGDHLELAQAEGRLVLLAAVRMLALGCAVALLLVTGWLFVVATLASIAWQFGVPLPWVLAGVALVFLLSGWLMWRGVLANARRLHFKATLHQLGMSNDGRRPEEP